MSGLGAIVSAILLALLVFVTLPLAVVIVGYLLYTYPDLLWIVAGIGAILILRT